MHQGRPESCNKMPSLQLANLLNIQNTETAWDIGMPHKGCQTANPEVFIVTVVKPSWRWLGCLGEDPPNRDINFAGWITVTWASPQDVVHFRRKYPNIFRSLELKVEIFVWIVSDKNDLYRNWKTEYTCIIYIYIYVCVCAAAISLQKCIAQPFLWEFSGGVQIQYD